MFGLVGMQRAWKREISKGQTADLLNNLILSGPPKPRNEIRLGRLRAVFKFGKGDGECSSSIAKRVFREVCYAFKGKHSS